MRRTPNSDGQGRNLRAIVRRSVNSRGEPKTKLKPVVQKERQALGACLRVKGVRNQSLLADPVDLRSARAEPRQHQSEGTQASDQRGGLGNRGRGDHDIPEESIAGDAG